jgi:hypothetical protein
VVDEAHWAQIGFEPSIAKPRAEVFIHRAAVEHLPGACVRADDYLEFRIAAYQHEGSNRQRARCVDVVLLRQAPPDTLLHLQRSEEAKALLRKTMPVARRVCGECDYLTLKLRWIYAEALNKDDGATLDDLREAVTTLEETEITARRVFGGGHPTVYLILQSLPEA